MNSFLPNAERNRRKYRKEYKINKTLIEPREFIATVIVSFSRVMTDRVTVVPRLADDPTFRTYRYTSESDEAMYAEIRWTVSMDRSSFPSTEKSVARGLNCTYPLEIKSFQLRVPCKSAFRITSIGKTVTNRTKPRIHVALQGNKTLNARECQYHLENTR